jgi:hypothetical protein
MKELVLGFPKTFILHAIISSLRHGSVGCGMAQLVACRAAGRPRVRISARHPSGGPLPELAAMKKLERNSANVMNECV